MRPLDVRLAVWVTALALLIAGVSAWGQDSDADKAQTLLRKGVEQYKVKEFAKSQETLLSVKREKLTATGQKELDKYLGDVRDAAKKAAAATEVNEDAQKAYRDGQYDKAKNLFDQVANSEYLPDPIRRDARTSAVLAGRKALAAAKPATPASAPAPELAAAPAATQSSEAADIKAILAKDVAAAEPKADTPVAAAADVAATAPAPAEMPAPAAPEAIASGAPVAANPGLMATSVPDVPAMPAETPAAEPVPVEAAPAAPAAAAPEATMASTPAETMPSETPATTVPAEATSAPAAEAAPAITAAPALEASSAPAVAEAVSASQPGNAAAASGPSPMDKPELVDLQRRIDATKLLISDGNAALDRGDLDGALSKLGQAVKIAPEYEPARVALARAQALTPQAEGQSSISKLQTQMSVRKQEVEVAYAQNVQQARLAIASPRSGEDFVQARNLAQNAKFLLTQNKNLFTDSEYRDKVVQTDSLVNFIAAEQDRWDKTQLAKQVREHEEQDRTRRLEAQRQQSEKIDTLKTRVRALVKEQKYEQAVEVVDRIRKLAPDDQWAAEQYETLNGFVQLRQDKLYYKQGLEEEQKQLIAVREAQIPWYELLKYPKDWPEISARRQKQTEGSVETDADRVIRKRLQQVQKKLEFPGIPFEQAVDFLRDLTGASIHVKWTALETAGVNKDTQVNVKLQEVTTETALTTILEDVGGVNPLAYEVRDGVIRISTSEDLAKDAQTRYYDVGALIVSVPNYAAPAMNLSNNGSTSGSGTSGSGTSGSSSSGIGSSGSAGMFGSSSGGGGSSGSGSGTSGTSGSSGTLVNGVTQQELIDGILESVRQELRLDPTDKSVRVVNGQLIVTQPASKQQKVFELLGQLRASQSLQVSVEARFIEVSTGFLNRIGIDLDFFFNTGSQTKATLTPTGTVATDPVTGATILNTSGGALLPQWNGTPGNNSLTALPVTQSSSLFTAPGQTSVPGSIGGTANSSALNIAGSFLDDIQVDFLINATQANQTSRSLTAPRLTMFNRQRAYIQVMRNQAYVANVIPVVVENVAAFQPVVATVGSGATLDVESTISADCRYVTMTIAPQVTAVNGFTEYKGAVDAKGNSIPGSGEIQLPNVSQQLLQCTVSVPDGGTLLLGGQKLAGEVEKEMGVPGLSKIPVLNRAFDNRSLVRDEQTLLILIKPKILIQREYEEAAFPP